MILGGECGFFYGMRILIIQLTKSFSKTNFYLISWAHILCYGIYFAFSFALYRYIIKDFSEFLTKLENIPTQNLHRNSVNSKNSLFLIGIEMIPLIFFFLFQPLKGTSCYSSSCYDQLTQYIYSRYLITFVILGFKLLTFIYLYI